MQLSELLTDELAAMTDKAIRAAQKKAGRDGDDIQFFHLRRKVRVHAGKVFLELAHPWKHERYGEPLQTGQSPHDCTGDWLAGRLQFHALDDGLKLFFSDKNPELELARRRFIVDEEERRAAVKSAKSHAEYMAQQQEQNRQNDRQVRWNALTKDTRVATRLRLTKPDATALEFADALAAEPVHNSTPPEGWGA
jgi:hypothetical protein